MNHTALIAQTLELVQALSPQQQNLPPEIAHISRTEQHGEMQLKNQFFKLAGVGELRSASVSSVKIEIVNLLFFPAVTTYLPVYAVEFVCLSAKPIVAVIDAKCLLAADNTLQVAQILQQAKASIDYLSPETQMPDWYLQSRSGNDLFVKSPSLAQMQTLMQLHLQIWQNLVELFVQPAVCPADLASLHAQHLQDYKDKHRLNYPGIPLLNRSFGEQWTTDYLKNYLFA